MLPNSLPSGKETRKKIDHDHDYRFAKTQTPPHNSIIPTATVTAFPPAPDVAAGGEAPPTVIVDVSVTTPPLLWPRDVVGAWTPEVNGTLFVVVAPSQATGSVLAVGIGVAVELLGLRTLSIIPIVSHSNVVYVGRKKTGRTYPSTICTTPFSTNTSLLTILAPFTNTCFSLPPVPSSSSSSFPSPPVELDDPSTTLTLTFPPSTVS